MEDRKCEPVDPCGEEDCIYCNPEEAQDLNVVNLAQRREENKEKVNPPDFVVERLKELYEVSANQKLKNLIVNYEFTNDKGELDGATMFFRSNNSFLEILGSIEVMKVAALEVLSESMYEEDGEDDY